MIHFFDKLILPNLLLNFPCLPCSPYLSPSALFKREANLHPSARNARTGCSTQSLHNIQPCHHALQLSHHLNMDASSRMAFLPSAPIHQHRLHAKSVTSPRRKTTSTVMLDQNTLIGAATAFAGIGGGIALVLWTESQGKRTDERTNVQSCFECNGDKTTVCDVCKGSRQDPIDPKLPCNYCDAVGRVKCFNCGGSGLQPRFLDRMSPEDFMD